jgi:hypothetical protein
MVSVRQCLEFCQMAKELLFLEVGILGLDITRVVSRVFRCEISTCHGCELRSRIAEELFCIEIDKEPTVVGFYALMKQLVSAGCDGIC